MLITGLFVGLVSASPGVEETSGQDMFSHIDCYGFLSSGEVSSVSFQSEFGPP